MAAGIATKDLVPGALFVALGAYFALEALTYEIGTPFRMGPGFMPLLLGTLLVLLGLGVAASGWQKPDDVREKPSWRAMVLIIGVIMFFGFTIRGLGFVPVTLVTGFGAALASRSNSPIFALMLAVGLSVLCTAIFVVGLGLTVPWFGPWLGQ